MVPRQRRRRRDDRGRHGAQRPRRRAEGAGGHLVQGVPERQGAGRPPRRARLRVWQPRLVQPRPREGGVPRREGAERQPARRQSAQVVGRAVPRGVDAVLREDGQRLFLHRRALVQRRLQRQERKVHEGHEGVLRRAQDALRPREAFLPHPRTRAARSTAKRSGDRTTASRRASSPPTPTPSPSPAIRTRRSPTSARSGRAPSPPLAARRCATSRRARPARSGCRAAWRTPARPRGRTTRRRTASRR